MGLNQGDTSHRFFARNGLWKLPCGVLLLSLVFALMGDTGRELLRYDRFAIQDGEVWRLFSGHFVHLGWSHFLLNAAGLVLVAFLVAAQFSAAQWLLILLLMIGGIDLGFWFLEPQLAWYVGLSGVLHGLLVAGVIAELRDNRGSIEFRVLAVLLVAKLAYEQLVGPLPGSEASSGGNVVVAAHLYGAIAGLLAGAWLSLRKARQAPI